MLFRRIRGRIVPIKDDKNATHQRRKDAVVGASAIGAGGAAVAYNKKIGRAVGNSVGDWAFKANQYLDKLARDKMPRVDHHEARIRDTAKHLSAKKDFVTKYAKEPALKDVFVDVGSPDDTSRAFMSVENPPVDAPIGKRVRKYKFTIELNSPREEAFLHELGHIEQFKEYSKQASPITSADYERPARAAKGAAKTHFSRAKTFTRELFGTLDEKLGLGVRLYPSRPLKKITQNIGEELGEAVRRYADYHKLDFKHQTMQFYEELDAWRRGARIAAKHGGPSRARMAAAAVMPLMSYSNAFVRKGVRASLIAGGASAVAYGAYRLLRSKK